MSDLNFVLLREETRKVDGSESFTPGTMYLNDEFFCYTCEDADRQLEKGGMKIKTRTAIPKGKYRVIVTFSETFGKPLPLLVDVHQFEGIRCHGGNRAEDSEGCILVGRRRTSDGIGECRATVQAMITSIESAETLGYTCWLEVRARKLA